MIHFEIEMYSGEKLVGSAKQIADQLRLSSRFEYDHPTSDYIARMAKRHNNIYKHKLIGISALLFCLSLRNSPLVKNYKLTLKGNRK